MASRNHKRNPSTGPKNAPPHGRSTRPGMTKRNTYHGHPSSSTSYNSGWSKKSTVEVVTMGDSAEDDSPSFLQFCATCEKQIITPNFSMLYCSEVCRKRDSISSTHSSDVSPSMIAHPGYPHKDIMPQRSPTIVRPLSNTFSELSLEATSPRNSTWDDQESNVQVLPGFPYAGASSPTLRRPDYKRMSSTTADDAPSLIHSPSSSYGTVASFTSTRPLPPRHPHTKTKSIDLVTSVAPTAQHSASTSPVLGPQNASLKSQASTLTTLRVAEAGDGDISYENANGRRQSDQRKASRSGSGQAAGSLKQLFGHDAMQGSASRSS